MVKSALDIHNLTYPASLPLLMWILMGGWSCRIMSLRLTSRMRLPKGSVRIKMSGKITLSGLGEGQDITIPEVTPDMYIEEGWEELWN